MKISRGKDKGFTLIELLVVISIISLLSSVVLSSLNIARMKARDAKRLQDIHQIQLALELYYNANGYYPTTGGTCGWYVSADIDCWPKFQTILAPYISMLPHDPTEDPAMLLAPIPTYGGQYIYAYTDYYADPCAGQFYVLEYDLEIAKGPNPGVVRCPSASTVPYDASAGADTRFKAVGISAN
jgi:prepilin-type N-terminal cleavage/methylation domain-containing protein